MPSCRQISPLTGRGPPSWRPGHRRITRCNRYHHDRCRPDLAYQQSTAACRGTTPHQLQHGWPAGRRINHKASGDVWLASGQSNMEWTLSQLPNLVELRLEASPTIRAARIEGDWQAEPTFANSEIEWFETDTRAGSGITSAVGYAFARTLQKHLKQQGHDRPIGIICNAPGGSFIESWMSQQTVMAMPAGQKRADLATTKRNEVRKHFKSKADLVTKWLRRMSSRYRSHCPMATATK